jgi:transcription factor E2F3
MADKSKHTLVTLTQGFVDILINAKGEEVDLTHVEDTLGVSKRRLYDVTNVLAGIGVLERCGKARVRWVGSATVPDSSAELQTLLAREAEVDRLTALMDESLATLAASPDFQAYAWVSEEDVMRLADEQMTLFALKGPTDVVIEVPEEEDPGRHRLICTSQSGSVDLIPIGAGGRA